MVLYPSQGMGMTGRRYWPTMECCLTSRLFQTSRHFAHPRSCSILTDFNAFPLPTAGPAPADLAIAQAESVIPAQPILLIIGKPAFVLERVSAFLRGLATIDIPILESGRITRKIIGGPRSGPRRLQRPRGALSLFRSCASPQYRYQKTCRHDRVHRKPLVYRNTFAARLELKNRSTPAAASENAS